MVASLLQLQLLMTMMKMTMTISIFLETMMRSHYNIYCILGYLHFL